MAEMTPTARGRENAQRFSEGAVRKAHRESRAEKAEENKTSEKRENSRDCVTPLGGARRALRRVR